MSDPEADRALAWPVTTRTATTVARGVAAGLQELTPLQPPAIVLEACGAVGALEPLEELIRSSGRPVLAAIGPSAPGLAQPAARLDAPLDGEGQAAVANLLASLPFLARVRCRRLVVPIGSGDLSGASGIRSLLAQSQDPQGTVTSWRQQASGEREKALDRLIRRLDLMARRERSVRFLLMPDSDPLGLLDLEAAEWILEDLPAGNVGVALELGAVGLQAALGGPGPAAWIESLGDAVELVLVADQDGRTRADMLPGTGITAYRDLADLLPRRVPWALRGDPGVPGTFLREASRFLEERLGRPPVQEDLLAPI